MCSVNSILWVCVNDPKYKDKFDNTCDDWFGKNCFESKEKWKYTAEEENELVSVS